MEKMYTVRIIEEKDMNEVANYEVEISKISFGDEAITDVAFHKNRLNTAYKKNGEGMCVLVDKDDKVKGWLWMDKKNNFLTNAPYINFRSFYIDDSIRGTDYVDLLMETGMEYAKRCRAKKIVGKVCVENLPMRTIYKKYGFRPTHLSMEIDL